MTIHWIYNVQHSAAHELGLMFVYT